MEAAEALGRGNLSTFYEAIRESARARSRVFWIVAGLTLLAAALRFATLGVQAYHHDEIVTASRILRDGFVHAMEAVGFSESAPPLYYALAWAWTQLTGTGEFGLRSLSALAGVATVPVAYLLGAELRGRRAGIVAAALVAVNPMLLWYSQEARGYALLAFFTAAAALYFVRALYRPRDVPVVSGPYGPLTTGTSKEGRRDLALWGIFSALALATHYFAIFPVALEAGWLLWRRGRRALVGLWIVALAGLALAPLAIHQMALGHAEWIGERSLGHRIWESAVTFVVGETGDIVARPETVLPALVPLLACAAALCLLAVRGRPAERRVGGRMLAVAAITVVAPVALALISPGKDYVIARNLLPALVPLLVAVAIGTTLRGARRSGALVAAVLAAYSFGFCIWVSVSPAWQRPDWNAVAAHLGEPEAPRAIVSWTLGAASLRYYLSTGSFQVQPADGYSWSVHEVDFVSDGPARPVPTSLLGPRFRQIGYEPVGRLYIRRYALPGPDLAHLRLRRVRDASLNFRSNGVLLDGIGPG
ncbi:MAG TPA: glycosyltransferase family 39 protein [Solirubrobacterales bacterium]|nr:glycosyltransferase family 39 protein [Solirubrobacterales bacterium]